MQLDRRATNIAFVVFCLVACGFYLTRLEIGKTKADDRDKLSRRVEKAFFFDYCAKFDQSFPEERDEAIIIGDVYQAMEQRKYEEVKEKASGYLNDTTHSWKFYYALGAILTDSKLHTMAQKSFAVSNRKLIEQLPGAYVNGNYPIRDLELDPRAAYTEACIHELQELQADKPGDTKNSAYIDDLYKRALQYSHPHGYIYKMYADYLRSQGKTKEADGALKQWDQSPAFRNYRSDDLVM